MTNSDIYKNTVFDHINPFPMLLCSVAAGFLIGILLDFFSLGERFFGKNRIITFFTDMLSVVATYMFMFVCAYNFNCGIIRWYCPVTVFTVFRAYRKTLSKPFLMVCGFFLDFAKKVLVLVSKLLSIPTGKLLSLSVTVYRRLQAAVFKSSRKHIYLRERSAIEAMAKVGFDLAPRLKEEKNGKKQKEQTGRKNRKACGNRDIADSCVSAHRLHKAANGAERAARQL